MNKSQTSIWIFKYIRINIYIHNNYYYNNFQSNSKNSYIKICHQPFFSFSFFDRFNRRQVTHQQKQEKKTT